MDPMIEYGLIPLHKILHTTSRNLRDRHMPPNEVKIRRHASTMEILDMWRNSSLRRETI
jgi:hypothetical protein